MALIQAGGSLCVHGPHISRALWSAAPVLSVALMRLRKVPWRAAFSTAVAVNDFEMFEHEMDGKSSKIDVESYVRNNLRPYNGDPYVFLQSATPRTRTLFSKFQNLLVEELKKGVLDVDPSIPSTVSSHGPGYLDRSLEKIVGFQTDAPLKRSIKPFGGINMVKKACESYGYKLDDRVIETFSKYRKTHNDAVFDLYTNEMRKARSSHIITGLPDAYGRGRIIGDYRRVALYGVDRLIEEKLKDKEAIGMSTTEDFQLREEVAEQIKALKELKEMASSYGFDVSRPAANAAEAIQFTYFGYLAAVKQQDGAAMSIGRLDGFLDIYIEKDIAEGRLTEEQAQELIDDLVMKLRAVRHLRTPEYNDLFAGDPTWVTLSLGGRAGDGKSMVSKTTYRFLQSLYNLGPAPEPNITILYSPALPIQFRRFVAQVSIDTSSLQYENDDLMRPLYGPDYAIACCVSPMAQGKQMQFFGARCNLAKLLLYSLNEGRDEITGEQVGPKLPKLPAGSLDFDLVMRNFDVCLEWMAKMYVDTVNCIHYSHDKYCYESLQMALHDTHIHRWIAFGLAGLSVVADSLSAIKHAQVAAIRDPNTGLTKDFKIEGSFPQYGNDDDRVDNISKQLVSNFINKLKQYPTYRNAEHTLSVLTITSNVVYGRNTGATPDGRSAKEAFAPGANPMHGRDTSGALFALNSVAKVPFESCRDGVSNTFSVVPAALGKTDETRLENLVGLLDGYFSQTAQHLNVNVLNRDTLLDAIEHPEKYPSLTIRVSGYAVNFTKLSRDKQLEVLARTFHERM